jgi:predicted PurR-regulated permease PerM
MDSAVRHRLINLLLVLLILIAAMFLTQLLWQAISGYADLLLLFVLGWLVSFILDPFVSQLSQRPVLAVLLPVFQTMLGESRAQALARFRFSRTAAVIIIYVVLGLTIVIAVALLAPPIITQLTQLASHLPDYVEQIPAASRWVQNQLAQFGVRINVQQIVDNALNSLQAYTATIIQNALGIFAGLLNLLANMFLVLIIGFIMTMDGPRLRQAVMRHVPPDWLDEARFFSKSVNRTFGGFLRGQLLQAFLIAIGTAIVMTLWGLDFVLVVSLFAGLFMLIPLVGPFLALIPPGLVALFQFPDATVWVLLILFVYQFIIVNVLMPRVLSDSLGLHPLLVFAAILMGIRVGGFWGAFFGIPVAGVIWAMALFFFERWQSQHVTDNSPSE